MLSANWQGTEPLDAVVSRQNQFHRLEMIRCQYLLPRENIGWRDIELISQVLFFFWLSAAWLIGTLRMIFSFHCWEQTRERWGDSSEIRRYESYTNRSSLTTCLFDANVIATWTFQNPKSCSSTFMNVWMISVRIKYEKQSASIAF